MTTQLQQLVDEYNAVRTANALGFTVAQVRTLDAIERESAEAIEVEAAHGQVWVTFEVDGFTWPTVLVRDDGTLDYRADRYA